MQHNPAALNQLPAPEGRAPIHTRETRFNAFARDDGLWDIEGELIDIKPLAFEREGEHFEAFRPIHHMAVRLTVDDGLVIRAVATAMASTPFDECLGARDPLQKLVGARMGGGWRRTIEDAMGGIGGCTHLRELVFNMATAAFQAVPHYIHHHRDRQGQSAGTPHRRGVNGQPPLYMGKCMAWDFDGPVVKRVAPEFAGWKPLKKA